MKGKKKKKPTTNRTDSFGRCDIGVETWKRNKEEITIGRTGNK